VIRKADFAQDLTTSWQSICAFPLLSKLLTEPYISDYIPKRRNILHYYTHHHQPSQNQTPTTMPTLPTRVLAGVAVPDSPLITKALSYTKAHLNAMAYNHVVRSWLFGVIIASKTPAPHDHDLDLEIHSIAALLHDLGWDTTGALVSADKRFEVGGANAACDFLRREAPHWDGRKVQLVWDAITLHTTASISVYKEAEVAATTVGIMADFVGPEGVQGGRLSKGEYERVLKEFPRLGMREGVKEIMCHLCRTKPETTYDNFVAGFGDRFVEGYSLEGRRVVDVMEGGVLDVVDYARG